MEIGPARGIAFYRAALAVAPNGRPLSDCLRSRGLLGGVGDCTQRPYDIPLRGLPVTFLCVLQRKVTQRKQTLPGAEQSGSLPGSPAVVGASALLVAAAPGADVVGAADVASRDGGPLMAGGEVVRPSADTGADGRSLLNGAGLIAGKWPPVWREGRCCGSWRLTRTVVDVECHSSWVGPSGLHPGHSFVEILLAIALAAWLAREPQACNATRHAAKEVALLPGNGRWSNYQGRLPSGARQ